MVFAFVFESTLVNVIFLLLVHADCKWRMKRSEKRNVVELIHLFYWVMI